MTGLQLAASGAVALGALAVVLTRDPMRQALVASVQGLLLVLFFVAFRAPDVAFSQLVVGGVALPAMLVLTIFRVNRRAR